MYRATKSKVADLANKVDDVLSPEMITPEGIRLNPPKVSNTKGSNVLEMRTGKTTAGNRRFEEAMRQKHLPEGTIKVLSGDELTQAAKITNRPAADQIAFVKSGKGYNAVITEITEGDKSITHLSDQLRGGKIIAQSDKDYGIETTNFVYRIVTNNEKLYKAIKANKAFQKEFRNPDVIFEGVKK